MVWPAAACAPARGAAPEARRRVAARRCVAGAWALRRGIDSCAKAKGACGSRAAAGPAACSSSWPAAGALTGPRARRGGRLPRLPAEALVQRRQCRAPARAHPRRAPAPGPASCPHRALRASSRLDGGRIWRVWCEGAERGRAGAPRSRAPSRQRRADRQAPSSCSCVADARLYKGAARQRRAGAARQVILELFRERQQQTGAPLNDAPAVVALAEDRGDYEDPPAAYKCAAAACTCRTLLRRRGTTCSEAQGGLASSPYLFIFKFVMAASPALCLCRDTRVCTRGNGRPRPPTLPRCSVLRSCSQPHAGLRNG